MLQESQHVYATKHVHIRVVVKVVAEFREYKYILKTASSWTSCSAPNKNTFYKLLVGIARISDNEQLLSHWYAIEMGPHFLFI